MTKRLWQLHSWLGLLAGAGLLVIGLSGSLLVFHDGIEELIHPGMLRVQPTAAGRLPLDRLIATLQRAFPDYEVTYWTRYQEPGWADVAYLVRHGERAARIASIDQYRGEIRIGQTDPNRTFTGWMLNLHYKFFAGTAGVAITAVLAVLLCLLGLSGLWLYRSFWRHLFRLRWRKSARIFFSDAHKMVGITSVAFNLILGVTGAYFNATELIGHFRGGGAETSIRPSGRLYAPTISLDQLLATTQGKLPGFKLSYIALPQQPHGAIVLGGRLPTVNPLRSDYGSSATFDAETGRLTATVDMRRASLLTQIVDTFVPVHFGTFGGWPVKILWCLAGLTPGLLATSGSLIWWQRRRRNCVGSSAQFAGRRQLLEDAPLGGD